MKLNDLVYTLGAFLMARDAAPFILGISGGQGAGKSTLCEALTEALEKEGKTAGKLIKPLKNGGKNIENEENLRENNLFWPRRASFVDFP